MRYDTVKIFTTKVGGRGSLDVTGNVRFTGLLQKSAGTDSVVVRDVNGNLGTTAKGTQLSGLSILPYPPIGIVQDGSGTTYKTNAERKHNVLDYGADSTGVANSATAINNASIAAAVNGGTVYFPNGIYKVDGSFANSCNCILEIPFTTYLNSYNQTTVIWEGESPTPVYSDPITGFPPRSFPRKGVIINFTGTAAAFSNVIGSQGDSAQWTTMNYTQFIMKNITVRVPSPASVNAVNATRLAMFESYNGRQDVNVYADSILTPTVGSSGLILPFRGNFVRAVVTNNLSTGYYYGLTAYEHANIDGYFSDANYYGLRFPQSDHSIHINKAIIARTKYTMKVESTSPQAITIDDMSIEKNAFGAWWDFVADLDEQNAGSASGAIKYTALGSVSNPYKFVRTNPAGSRIFASAAWGNLPFWATANRPLNRDTATTGFNTTTGLVETWNGTAWLSSGTVTGSGTTNELTYWSSATAIGALAVATYPSLTELSYVKGVTSAIQTQMNLKAPIASPTFTGTVTIPTPFTLGATSVTSTGTQLNYLNAATGTTGTASTNLVYSASPALTGTATAEAISMTGVLTQINTSSGTVVNLTGDFVGNKIVSLTNADGGNSQAIYQTANGTSTANYGLTGTGYSTYGALLANTAYLYASGASGITLMADNAGGQIIMTTGGNTAQLTITAAGVITAANLAGSGSRAVLAAADGSLSAPVSDETLKYLIRSVSGSVDAVSLLYDNNIRGVYWNWKDEKRFGKQREIGFTAQMFENIPGMTGTMTKSGEKYLNYDRITVLLWEQNREQQKQIDKLKDEIKNLKIK